jgi:hypothetical protein
MITDIEDELFMMTNLFPATTGLPMVVWVGPGYGLPHDVRIKVMQSHGNRMNINNLAVVALRPTPHVVEGHLTTDDLDEVKKWININRTVIIDHWNGASDGVQLGQQLRKI